MAIKVGEVSTLQALCGEQIRRQVDHEIATKPALKAHHSSSLSLTTAKVLQTLGAKSTSSIEASWSVLEIIAHPLVLVEWQNANSGKINKNIEAVWRLLCEQKGYLPAPGDLAMSWEQRFFKDHLAKALMQSYGNFKEVAPQDWHLFYHNRSRVHTLDLGKNPYLKEGKLKEICSLFSEITHFSAAQCSGMAEKDWVAAFSQLKKLEQVDLGLNMAIGTKTLETLAKNAKRIHCLNLQGISHLVDLVAIVNLCKKAPHLSTLTLGEKKHLSTVIEIKQAINAAPALHSLELKGFKKLTFQDVDLLLKSHPGLQKLILKECPALKNTDIAHLSAHSLVQLEIIDCKQIDEVLAPFELNERLPNLQKLSCFRRF